MERLMNERTSGLCFCGLFSGVNKEGKKISHHMHGTRKEGRVETAIITASLPVNEQL